MMTTKAHLTWRGAAWKGAKIGAALSGLYSAVFGVYVCIRALWSIASILDPSDAFRTGAAIIFSLLIPVLVIGLMMALISALLGTLTGGLVFELLRRYNPARVPDRAMALGLGLALGIALLIYGLSQSLLGGHLSPAHIDAYVFWLALPLLIYIAAGMIGARRINRFDAA